MRSAFIARVRNGVARSHVQPIWGVLSLVGIISDGRLMAGCTRKGGMKHYGGRKRTTTRRHGRKPRKTVRRGRKGGMKSGHKKRSRRGRKHGGGLLGDLKTAFGAVTCDNCGPGVKQIFGSLGNLKNPCKVNNSLPGC